MDLGYIHGERESGPNGAKKLFLSKSAAFLRALAKDLCFKEHKVTTNPAGIAVSGDVTLRGMWGEGNGLYLQISQPINPFPAFLYRDITGMKDYAGGANQWLNCAYFADGDYHRIIHILSSLRKKADETEANKYAA